jgi:hypothetical protein
VIANSIAMIGGWSPLLRKKLFTLGRNQSNEGGSSPEKQLDTLQKSVQRRLWSIMDSTLPVTIGMKSAIQKVDQQFKNAAMEELKGYLFPDENPGELGDGGSEQIVPHVSEDVLISEEQYLDDSRLHMDMQEPGIEHPGNDLLLYHEPPYDGDDKAQFNL